MLQIMVARLLIARIMVSWVWCRGRAAIRGARGFYVFLFAGAAERLFPGVIVISAPWFPGPERAPRFCVVHAGQPDRRRAGSGPVGATSSPDCVGLPRLASCFLVEGFPAVVSAGSVRFSPIARATRAG